MKKSVFTGVATALITPFDKQGKIDYGKFAELVEFQIREGINALVVAGTTGEASTFGDDEHRDAISFVVKQTNGRVPVIAGAGSNDTAYAKGLVEHACAAGADAVLLVTPYYNKATQRGLINMYTELADASEKPVILYNVPSRTGVNIEPETYLALSEHPNIVAFKEANGNMGKIVQTASLLNDKLDMYSGNDDQIVPILSLGGKGVISVLSNLLPAKTVEICDRFFRGDIEGSRKLQLELIPLVNALFCEVNPIPAKAAMARLGYTENILRSPLCPMEEAHEEMLLNEMRKVGLKV
ncbi:MAG: 4-hydroxy-tetrahydrodipicolinate synthase [Clostridia bacterium]|nr:4-hydroxy-tetrahydrodipicolinate synthase [Clostridia bacterium]